MHVHGAAVPVEAEFQHPVRRRGPGLRALLPFRLAAFLVGDPPAGAFEVGELYAFEEAQQVETAGIVHAFDSMMGVVHSNPAPGRYHLQLTTGGRPVVHGWWGSEATARRKMASWIGDWGQPGTRVTLTDEETGEQLAAWPDEDGGTVSAES